MSDENKTPISALQEYCVKNLLAPPRYEFSETSINNNNESKLFTCTVEVLNQKVNGLGISKKNAKHDAAANIIKKLSNTNSEINHLPTIAPHSTLTINAIDKLRDLCLERNYPLPTLEIIDEGNKFQVNPLFTAECSVLDTKCKGIASSKKAAKHLAAHEVFKILETLSPPPPVKHEAFIKEFHCDIEAEINTNRLKSYHDIVTLKNEPCNAYITDTRKFFKILNSNVRKTAKAILDDVTIRSDKIKMERLLEHLNIKYRIQKQRTKLGYVSFIEFLTGVDAVFSAPEEQIYNEILNYFRDML